jgi:hypothetical protein
MEKIYNFGLKDFAGFFGTTVEDIPEVCRKIIKKSDFRYRRVSALKQVGLISEINKRIDGDYFFTAGKKAKSIWQKRWSNQLKDFVAEDFKTASLVPKYVKKPVHDTYFRFNHGFITPLDENFELNWKQVFKYWLFGKYLKNVDHIYEFGCGTGINMAILAELFPQKKLHCSDWVDSSKKIAEHMSKKYHWNVSGHVFDMFHPDSKFKIEKNSAFLTCGALEQMGTGYKSFINFAVKNKIDLFVNVEPIKELFDKTDPLDALAIKFINKRHYLSNYLTHLGRLQKEGKIKIQKTQRVYPGSFYQDLSYIVWRPIKLKAN